MHFLFYGFVICPPAFHHSRHSGFWDQAAQRPELRRHPISRIIAIRGVMSGVAEATARAGEF